MKKLLVLACLLCISAFAPAALQISVEGDPDPVDSEITIYPSDMLNLGIYGDGVPVGQALYWLMMVDETMGALFYDDGYIHPYVYYPNPYPGYSWVGGAIDGIVPIPPGQLVDGIEFHCEAQGDAIVALYSSADTVYWELADTVIIHQIPEPATMVLLGLGGLLVSRRRISYK